jgi:hypothetical protein
VEEEAAVEGDGQRPWERAVAEEARRKRGGRGEGGGGGRLGWARDPG